MNEESQRFTDYVNGVRARSEAAHLVRDAIDLRAVSARNLVLTDNPAELMAEKALVDKAQAAVEGNLQHLQSLAQGDRVPAIVKQKIAEIARIEQTYAPVAAGIVKLALEKETDEAIARINKDCRPLLASLIKATDDYAELPSKRSAALILEAEENFTAERNRLIVACVLEVLGTVVASVLILKSINRPLRQALEVVSRVAEGDLSSSVAVTSHDKFGQLLGALGTMKEKLTQVVIRVRQGGRHGINAVAASIMGAWLRAHARPVTTVDSTRTFGSKRFKRNDRGLLNQIAGATACIQEANCLARANSASPPPNMAQPHLGIAP